MQVAVPSSPGDLVDASKETARRDEATSAHNQWPACSDEGSVVGSVARCTHNKSGSWLGI
ncbi:MAG: hypothetical protein FJ040_08770 [Chloroflexi bacterium]|nr:hypothetical protein [Chloroflexota bacterium]